MNPPAVCEPRGSKEAFLYPLAKQLCCGLAHVVYRCLQSVAGLGGGWTCGKNRTGVTALGNNCSYVRRFVFEIHLISVRVTWVRAFILWPHSRCQHWTRENRSWLGCCDSSRLHLMINILVSSC